MLDNSLFWIMQSQQPSIKLKRNSCQNSTIYVVPSLAKSNFLCKLLDNVINIVFKFSLSLILIKSKNICLIHTHDGADEGLVSLILSRFCNTKMSYAYTTHFITSRKYRLMQMHKTEKLLKQAKFALQKLVYKLILKKSDIVFPISHHLKIELHESLNIPFSKMTVVPQAASRFFLDYVKKNRPGNGPKRLVYAGSLGKKRNIHFIIDAFQHVIREFNNVELLLLGWGERKDDIASLKEYVISKSLTTKVKFLERVPYYQVPKIVSKADIGLSPIPPLEEYLVSSPTKCIEYLSLRLPVVANSEIYDQKHILHSSNGGILAKYDEMEFASAILRLLCSAELRHKCAISGYQWIKENRTFGKLAQEINCELQRVVYGKESSGMNRHNSLMC